MNVGGRRDEATAPHSRRTLLLAALTGAAAVATGCAPKISRAGSKQPTGKPGSSATVVPGGVALGIVGILVDDLARSLDFYRRLGLDIPDSAGADSFRLRMPDGHVLFWETAAVVRSFDPRWELPPPSDRRIVLEFGFGAPDDLDATYRGLVAAGAPSRLAPFDQGGGIRYAVVVDPDGNQIALRNPAL